MWPQALLEVVNDLFEEQTDLEKIVRKIMQRALTLLQCERCSVLLLEDIDSPVRPLAPYQLLSFSCLADLSMLTFFIKPCSLSLLLNDIGLPVTIRVSSTGCEVLQDI